MPGIRGYKGTRGSEGSQRQAARVQFQGVADSECGGFGGTGGSGGVKRRGSCFQGVEDSGVQGVQAASSGGVVFPGCGG